MPDIPLSRDFGSDCRSYQSVTPPYPNAVLDFIASPEAAPVDIVDLGAGTGLAAIALAQRGHRVVAVEHDSAMAAPLYAIAGLRPIEAFAEATGLPDDSADLVVCAQSFHWFEPPAALAEINRLLRTHGKLAIIWRSLDRDDPLTDRFAAFRDDMVGPPLERVRGLSIHTLAQSGFVPASEASFPTAVPLDVGNIFDYVASRRNRSKEPPAEDVVVEAFHRTFNPPSILLRGTVNVIKFSVSNHAATASGSVVPRRPGQ